MANKFFKNSTPAANLQRNAFDLSRKSLFTANIGQLLPFFCLECNPGDHIVLNSNTFTRTQPVNSAAYVRAKECREFFFVPYRYLWSYWEQFITQVKDYHSTLMSASAENTVPSKVPMISLRDLYSVYMAPYDGSTSARGNIKDSNGQYMANNFLRLFNMLEYGMPYYDKTVDDHNIPIPASILSPEKYNAFINANFAGIEDYQINPFRVLAYQKIFYDYYRKSDYDGNIVAAYNIDYPRPSSVNTLPITSLVNMFEIHYRPWKKDYYMSVKPSTYWYGSLSDGILANNGVDNSQLSTLARTYLPSQSIGSSGSSVTLSTSVNLQTRQIKAAFAIDKYLRTTQKAGKHYDDQILAHFGVKPSAEISKETMFIGSWENPLVISEVTSLADTTTAEGSGAAVGQQFGKGVVDGTSPHDDIVFDAKEHGILMGIYSASLEADYNSRGISPFNIKEKRSDYFIPEFQDLGPHMLMSEFVDFARTTKNNRISSVYGLVEPYLEYKIGIDKVFGEFQTDGNLQSWAAPRTLAVNLNPSSTDSTLVRSELYQNPSIADSIFAVASNIADQLFVNDYMSVSAVRNMTVHES